MSHLWLHDFEQLMTEVTEAVCVFVLTDVKTEVTVAVEIDTSRRAREWASAGALGFNSHLAYKRT
mgnify:FL=1